MTSLEGFALVRRSEAVPGESCLCEFGIDTELVLRSGEVSRTPELLWASDTAR